MINFIIIIINFNEDYGKEFLINSFHEKNNNTI